MSVKTDIAVLVLVFAAGCQSGVRTGDLSEDEQKNLQYVAKENVASLGAPPMIPADHEFEIGSDIYGFENGGETCLDCHNDDSEEDIIQTSHPERHNCMQCHLPQVGDALLDGDFKVDNSFIKYDPAAADR